MKNTLKLLVTEAVIVDRNLHLLALRSRALKKRIVQIASHERDSHQPTPGGGASWIGEGFDGCIARVSFPGHTLLSAVDPETPRGQQLLARLGPRKLELLRPIIHYEPVNDFRERVRGIFDNSQSQQIIAACQSPSPPRVSFATKQAARARCPGPRLSEAQREKTSKSSTVATSSHSLEVPHASTKTALLPPSIL